MAHAEQDKPAQNRRTIPTDSGGNQYPEELDLYLTQLFDEALDETPPGSAVPSQRTVDKK
jgi:hypothetical protein